MLESRLSYFEFCFCACRVVGGLLQAGLTPFDVGVVTPYRSQVELIRKYIPDTGIKIGSVEEFQVRTKLNYVLKFSFLV